MEEQKPKPKKQAKGKKDKEKKVKKEVKEEDEDKSEDAELKAKKKEVERKAKKACAGGLGFTIGRKKLPQNHQTVCHRFLRTCRFDEPTFSTVRSQKPLEKHSLFAHLDLLSSDYLFFDLKI